MNRYTLLLILLAACCSSTAVVAQDVSLTTDQVAAINQLAEQGDANAQFILGNMYLKGEGVAKKDAEAVKWYRLAADQGNADAQHNLGLKYAKGEGVPKNDVEAYFWWNLAAAQGHADAKTNRDIVEKTMTREQIAEAQQRSAAWEPNRW